MSDSLLVKSHRGDYKVKFLSGKKAIWDIHMDKRSEYHPIFLVIDSKINDLYPWVASEPPGFYNSFILKADEKNKTYSTCKHLLRVLVERKVDKNHTLIAVGGGITQDVTAFVASIFCRGIDWKFMPTTLLAQADSCIGSKTSINFDGVKNLVGTFYPPSEIFCDTDFLNTLSVDDIKSGIGEILHYYLLKDHEAAEQLMRSYDTLLRSRKAFLPHIKKSLSIKKEVIELDEFDQAERRIFNYGHTFGHAIEVLSDYKVPHGQAVTYGMRIANYIAYRRGLIDWEVFSRLNGVLGKNMPDFSIIKSGKLDHFVDLLLKDKKSVGQSVVCVLPYGIEDMRVTKISDLTVLEKYIFDEELSWKKHS